MIRVAAAVGEIIATELDVDDGLEFDADSIRTEVMREGAEYQGVRVKLIARLATARMTTTLDFSFGDPHQSTVIEVPELLGTGTIRLASSQPDLTLPGYKGLRVKLIARLATARMTTTLDF